MGERSYTVMIVPGSRAKLLRLKVRQGVLVGLGVIAVIGLLSTTLLPFVYHKSIQRSAQVSTLEQELHSLREANQEIASLREQVSFFENRATKFALMAGVEDLPSARGVGGLREVESSSLFDDEIENLKERSGVLEESFDRLEQVYQDQSLLLATTPSVAPVKGWISYGYAWRRDPFTGKRAFHRGLDIVAPSGTRVLAPADAVVVKAGRMVGYGNVIYLSHGNGLTSRYAHLKGFAVNPGQEVVRGDEIGFVGNTGRSLGAHLHYEVLVNKRRVDPSRYILDDNLTF